MCTIRGCLCDLGFAPVVLRREQANGWGRSDGFVTGDFLVVAVVGFATTLFRVLGGRVCRTGGF